MLAQAPARQQRTKKNARSGQGREEPRNPPYLVVPEGIEGGLGPHVAPSGALPVVVPGRETGRKTVGKA